MGLRLSVDSSMGLNADDDLYQPGARRDQTESSRLWRLRSIKQIQFHLDRTKWPKAFSMNRAGPKRLDRCQMLRRRIPLMFCKTIARMDLVEFSHQTIACHLGQHAGGGARITFCIAIDQRSLVVG